MFVHVTSAGMQQWPCRICEQEKLDPVVSKTELFMLTSKMLLNKQMARKRHVIVFFCCFSALLAGGERLIQRKAPVPHLRKPA